MKCLISALGMLLLTALSEAIMFHLPVSAIKCLKSEGRKDALIVGQYEASPIAGQQVDLLVTDSHRRLLASLTDIKSGRFSFVTDSDELFEMCFSSKGPVHLRDSLHTVEILLKRGVEARSDDELQIAEKLKPLETDVIYAEKLADSIVEEFATMKAREEALSDTNESTLDRVTYLGIFNVIWLVLTVVTQLKYLHSYFKSKKLVE